MKTVSDYKGNTYALDQVIAVLKGGTPHIDLPLPRVPVAVLVYPSGARVDTLIPFTVVLAAWAGKPAATAGAPGMVDAPPGIADAEVAGADAA